MFSSFKKFSPADTDNQEPESNTSPYSAPQAAPVNPWQAEPQEPVIPSHAPVSPGIQRAQPTRNVLNSDVEVKGALRFIDDLLVDGVVEGKINSEGTLTIGQNARIQAEIRTKSVIIHGKVVGNITVSDRVELKATAELVGDIQAATFSVESGAIFIGHSTVGAPSLDIPVAASRKAAKQATLPVVEAASEEAETKASEMPSTPEMQF